MRALQLTIKNNAELKTAYLPFVNNGAVFVATQDKFQLNETINLDIHLFSAAQTLAISGNVVWITPSFAQGGSIAGVGIQFPNIDTRDKLEALMAGGAYVS